MMHSFQLSRVNRFGGLDYTPRDGMNYAAEQGIAAARAGHRHAKTTSDSRCHPRGGTVPTKARRIGAKLPLAPCRISSG